MGKIDRNVYRKCHCDRLHSREALVTLQQHARVVSVLTHDSKVLTSNPAAADRSITNVAQVSSHSYTIDNSAFCPSEVGKSSTGLLSQSRDRARSHPPLPCVRIRLLSSTWQLS